MTNNAITVVTIATVFQSVRFLTKGLRMIKVVVSTVARDGSIVTTEHKFNNRTEAKDCIKDAKGRGCHVAVLVNGKLKEYHD